jgi:hypothetical protein
MAKQDDWVRLQLRLPRSLHAELQRYADNTSLNSAILTLIELGLLGQTIRTLPPRPSTARIVLDSDGRTLTREEVQRQLAALVEASDLPLTHLQIEVLTPAVLEERSKMVSGSGRYPVPQDLDPDAGTPFAGFRELIRKERAYDMSIVTLIDRVEAGEDLREAFYDELRKHRARTSEATPR